MNNICVSPIVVMCGFASAVCSATFTASASDVQVVKTTIRIPGARWTNAFDGALDRIAIVRETPRRFRTSVVSLDDGRQLCDIAQPEQVNGWGFGVGIERMSFLEGEEELLIVDTEGRLIFYDMKRQVIDRVVRLPWFVLHYRGVTDREIGRELKSLKRFIGDIELAVLHGLRVRSVARIPETRDLLVLYADGTLVVLDMDTSRLKRIVRAGSFEMKRAEFGEDVHPDLAKFLPRLFGTRFSGSTEWVVPESIRIGTKPDHSTDWLLLGCLGHDAILADQYTGIVRLNIESGEERWRTETAAGRSTLTANGKLIAQIEDQAVRLYRTSDGKFLERIPGPVLGPQDVLIEIMTDASGEVFLLRTHKERYFYMTRSGVVTEIRRDDAEPHVHDMALSSDGKRIAFLTSASAVEVFEVTPAGRKE